MKYYGNKNIIYTEIDNEAVLLNLKDGIYYGLDEIGAFVWKYLVEGVSIFEIIQNIENEYNVEPDMIEQISQDITQFVNDLERKSIILQEK